MSKPFIQKLGALIGAQGCIGSSGGRRRRRCRLPTREFELPDVSFKNMRVVPFMNLNDRIGGSSSSIDSLAYGARPNGQNLDSADE